MAIVDKVAKELLLAAGRLDVQLDGKRAKEVAVSEAGALLSVYPGAHWLRVAGYSRGLYNAGSIVLAEARATGQSQGIAELLLTRNAEMWRESVRYVAERGEKVEGN